MKKYLVSVSMPTGFITYYFDDLGGSKGAATFFYRYCKLMGVNKPKCLSPSTQWHRQQHCGLTVDFECIKEINLSIAFNLQ